MLIDDNAITTDAIVINISDENMLSFLEARIDYPYCVSGWAVEGKPPNPALLHRLGE